MKHTALIFSPLAVVAALALATWSPVSTAQAQNQQELQKKLDDARAQLDKSAREVAELSLALGRDGARVGNPAMSMEGPPPRAMLGVQIASNGNDGGAKIVEVSPGGAAAEAGIKAGDIITSIGGHVIATEPDPGRALVERMAQIEPNLKVSVGVMRDGKAMALELTPRPAPVQMFRLERRGPGGAQGMGPPMPPMPGMGGPMQRREIIINRGEEGGMGTRFRGIEFATLSEKLGSYFGVKSGVLVVRSGNNPAFKLQDGDVILAIDGRTPSNAQHAGRILRSYSSGEKLVIRVQRDRKAQNLEVTVPGGAED